MTVKLLAEQHLEFLSLKGGCTGWSESIFFKMPHCWKPHVTAHCHVEAEEGQPEETETNQPELIDQTKRMHHIDHGYSVSFDSMDSASINIDIGFQQCGMCDQQSLR